MVKQEELKQRQIILDLASKYKFNEKHAAFVENSALKLFDSLKSIHKLSHPERVLLSHAALLHDIGAYINKKAHNKHTKYIIENDEMLSEYPETDRKCLSLITYNHRKKIRKDTLKLEKKEKSIVLKLSALLRVADSLYYNNDDVTIKSVVLENSVVNITIVGILPERLNKRLLEKKDLFLDVFELDINLV